MEPEKKSSGALVGSIVVIIVIILGGIYFWMNQIEDAVIVNEENQNAVELEATIIQTENSLKILEDEMLNSGIENLNLENEVSNIE